MANSARDVRQASSRRCPGRAGCRPPNPDHGALLRILRKVQAISYTEQLQEVAHFRIGMADARATVPSLAETNMLSCLNFSVKTETPGDSVSVFVEVFESPAKVGGKKGETSSKSESGGSYRQIPLSSALSVIGFVASAASESLQEVKPKPKETEITFGLKAARDLNGFVITSPESEAAFVVRIKWEPKA